MKRGVRREGDYLSTGGHHESKSSNVEMLLDVFITSPKSSPNEGKLERKPHELWNLKSRANMESRVNREIREIREHRKLSGEQVWIFRVFRVFCGSKKFLGEDLGHQK